MAWATQDLRFNRSEIGTGFFIQHPSIWQSQVLSQMIHMAIKSHRVQTNLVTWWPKMVSWWGLWTTFCMILACQFNLSLCRGFSGVGSSFCESRSKVKTIFCRNTFILKPDILNVICFTQA